MQGVMQVVSKPAYTSWSEEQSTAAYGRNSKKAGEEAPEGASAERPEVSRGTRTARVYHVI